MSDPAVSARKGKQNSSYRIADVIAKDKEIIGACIFLTVDDLVDLGINPSSVDSVAYRTKPDEQWLIVFAPPESMTD